MLSDKHASAICALIFFVILFIIYVNFINNKTTHIDGSFIDLSFDKTIDKTSFKNGTVSIDDIIYSQNFIRNHFNTNASEELVRAHWFRIIQYYIQLPLENGYGSHKLTLLAASILTTKDDGPVMEMGCGYHSTILLHQIVVNEQKRYLLSTDTDREWLSKFETNMSSSNHQFRHIAQTSEWDQIGNDRPRWSIVFIDHKPGNRRVVDIIRLANVSDIVIVHDTEMPTYFYEPGLSLYTYRYRYNYLPTCTDITSKTKGELFKKIQYLLELTIKMKLPKL